MSRLSKQCDECGRVFDLADPEDANEWAYGHDCETEYDYDEGSDLDFQELIDSGLAWRLEGSIGRQCHAAIEAGVCTLGPVAHTDYYGSRVPAIHEVEPGTLGSLEYAEARR